MESIDDVMIKRFGKPLVWFMKLVDPEREYSIDQALGEAWDALELTEQRRMYLYIKYKKWRGEPLYGTPYEIIKGCHPYPTNWNGRPYINRLMKDKTPLVSAIHKGNPGIFTLDEAKIWQMTNVKPLNF